MSAVEIHGFAQSTYVRTARMACVEKGVDHELMPLDFRSDAHRALHPFLRMPVMRDGDVLLFESLAIVTYLDEARDGPALQPGDPLGRARMLAWVTAATDYVHSTLLRPFLGADALSPEQVTAARGNLEIVDKALSNGPFLIGDTLTLADLYLAPMIAFAEGQAQFGELTDGLGGLARWREVVWTRDSFQQTLPG